MKTTGKAIWLGIISFVVFMFGNFFIGSIIGVLIPGGDDFMNSYFHPLYAGVCTLAAIIISCTYIIVKKMNMLLEERNK